MSSFNNDEMEIDVVSPQPTDSREEDVTMSEAPAQEDDAAAPFSSSPFSFSSTGIRTPYPLHPAPPKRKKRTKKFYELRRRVLTRNQGPFPKCTHRPPSKDSQPSSFSSSSSSSKQRIVKRLPVQALRAKNAWRVHRVRPRRLNEAADDAKLAHLLRYTSPHVGEDTIRTVLLRRREENVRSCRIPETRLRGRWGWQVMEPPPPPEPNEWLSDEDEDMGL